MKAALLLASGLLLVPTALAETTSLTLGPVDAELVLNDLSACPTAGAPAPCIIGYDDAGTPLPTDDTVYAYRSIESLRVSVEQSTAPAPSVSFDLRETVVEHPIIVVGDALIVTAEQALPSPVGDLTRTESYETGTRLVVRGPALNGTTLAETDYSVPFFFFGTDRNGTTFPYGVAVQGLDTDVWAPSQLEALRLCFIPQLGDENAVVCNAFPAGTTQEAWPHLTPRFFLGVSANKTSVSLAQQAPALPLEWQGDSGTAPVSGEGAAAALPAGDAQRIGAPSRDDAVAWQVEPQVALEAASLPVAAARASFLAGVGEVPSWLLAAALLLALPFAWLYNRVTRARALEQENRVRILDLARAEPGIQVGEMARRLGLAYHTTAHHAQVLKRCGHLEIVTLNRSVALYPVGSVPLRHRAGLIGLRRGPQAGMLRLVLAHPGRSLTSLAALDGHRKSSVLAKLQRLTAHGLVRKDAEGLYSATPLGTEALRFLHASEPREGGAEPSVDPSPAPAPEAAMQPLAEGALAPNHPVAPGTLGASEASAARW